MSFTLVVAIDLKCQCFNNIVHRSMFAIIRYLESMKIFTLSWNITDSTLLQASAGVFFILTSLIMGLTDNKLL